MMNWLRQTLSGVWGKWLLVLFVPLVMIGYAIIFPLSANRWAVPKLIVFAALAVVAAWKLGKGTGFVKFAYGIAVLLVVLYSLSFFSFRFFPRVSKTVGEVITPQTAETGELKSLDERLNSWLRGELKAKAEDVVATCDGEEAALFFDENPRQTVRIYEKCWSGPIKLPTGDGYFNIDATGVKGVEYRFANGQKVVRMAGEAKWWENSIPTATFWARSIGGDGNLTVVVERDQPQAKHAVYKPQAARQEAKELNEEWKDPCFTSYLKIHLGDFDQKIYNLNLPKDGCLDVVPAGGEAMRVTALGFQLRIGEGRFILLADNPVTVSEPFTLIGSGTGTVERVPGP